MVLIMKKPKPKTTRNPGRTNYARDSSTLDPLQLLRVREVAALLNIHRMTVWSWSKTGRLPKPIKLAPKVSAWRRSDLATYIARKATETQAG